VEFVSGFELRTPRLLLREWRDSDRAPFALLNADPAAMEFFPSTLERPASDALIDRFEHEFATLGYCPWAVELAASSQFIGFVGLHSVAAAMPFAPAIEVGWRLALPYWGLGYATEAATRALAFAFEDLGFEEIVSFTSVPNLRSQRVMTRLGMSRDRFGDFEHPGLRPGDRLRPHVLYRKHAPHLSKAELDK
jgi:ribosomal-protein-alanine N-acetyltransferase